MPGMRVEPPTRRMRSSWPGRTPASSRAVVTERMVRASSSSMSRSKSARLSSQERCFGSPSTEAT